MTNLYIRPLSYLFAFRFDAMASSPELLLKQGAEVFLVSTETGTERERLMTCISTHVMIPDIVMYIPLLSHSSQVW